MIFVEAHRQTKEGRMTEEGLTAVPNAGASGQRGCKEGKEHIAHKDKGISLLIRELENEHVTKPNQIQPYIMGNHSSCLS